MAPSSKIFFEEVRAAYAETAGSLRLAGPVETENVLPVSTYTAGGVEYSVELDIREGYVDCVVGTETETVDFTVNVEQLALTAGVIEVHGKISYSARNLTQLRKSLSGQARYVRLVHPLLADKATEALMRRAGARAWKKPARP
ncbi:hypothetical protein [Streptomyces sp. NBC_00989]|uniref:hypothetical protein n=1 Tax=Streptomyces sp. NBC_00989 TaxID=2903705 RepID=UPI003868E1B7|nr:hypothetical protein OG714_00550 [Streptomyces sp. NBC_00989]WSW98068.1 hypothetical protein OG714_53590 [Streptomyces sp. NBC_00989]